MNLLYRAKCTVDDLEIGQCTIHRATNAQAARWWLLWFYANRETDGQPEWFGVPVSPGGVYTENGPGGRTWGLQRTGVGIWQVSPSINVLDDRDAAAGPQKYRSIWHQTPALMGVPDDEPWAQGEPP